MVSCRFSQQNQSNDTMDYDDIIYPPVSKHDIASYWKWPFIVEFSHEKWWIFPSFFGTLTRPGSHPNLVIHRSQNQGRLVPRGSHPLPPAGCGPSLSTGRWRFYVYLHRLVDGWMDGFYIFFQLFFNISEHFRMTGWWCNNHLEEWWSSSMGRMTSHIWNGNKTCLKPPTRW